jgi:hypothetical protein
LTCRDRLVTELIQETRRLIPQLRQLLDDRLALTKPAVGLVSRLAEYAAQVFGEPSNSPFDAATFNALCTLRHLASEWIPQIMPIRDIE